MSAEETPPPTQRLAFVDGLRGVAVLGVVVFHAFVWAGEPMARFPFRIAAFGRCGVDLFLVISGFCLFWPLVKRSDGERVEPLATGEYLRRRARRILPPYWAAIALMFAVGFIAYRFGDATAWPHVLWSPMPFRAPESLYDLASHVTLTHGFFNDYAHSIDGSFWSLSLEAQFYVLLIPLAGIALLAARAGRPRLGVALAIAIPVVVSLVYRGVLSVVRPEFLATYVGDELSLGRWVEFAAGMLAATLLARSRGRTRPLAWPFALVALAVAAALEYWRPLSVWLPFAWAAACFGVFHVVSVATPTNVLRRVFEFGPLVRLGRMSYSVFLTHDAVFLALTLAASLISPHPAGRAQQIALYVFVGVPLTIAAGRAFFAAVERRFLTPSARREA